MQRMRVVRHNCLVHFVARNQLPLWHLLFKKGLNDFEESILHINHSERPYPKITMCSIAKCYVRREIDALSGTQCARTISCASLTLRNIFQCHAAFAHHCRMADRARPCKYELPPVPLDRRESAFHKDQLWRCVTVLISTCFSLRR